MDLRCQGNKLHGIIDDGVLEKTCDSRFCGKRDGVVVLHRWNVLTGELIETVELRDPAIAFKEGAH